MPGRSRSAVSQRCPVGPSPVRPPQSPALERTPRRLRPFPVSPPHSSHSSPGHPEMAFSFPQTPCRPHPRGTPGSPPRLLLPTPPHPSVLPALPTRAERPPRVTRRPARLSPRPSSSSSPARPPPPPSSKCLQPLCSLTFCSEIILDLQKGAETQSQEAPSACVPCPPTPGMTSPGTRIKTPIRTVPVPHSRGTS